MPGRDYSFSFYCGCECRCGTSLRLEGVDDANGTHYCRSCRDFVAGSPSCKGRLPELVAKRAARIARNNPGSEQ